MPPEDVVREGERIMTICNACRYCEGFCAVFPAMERRQSFATADLNYLANLCHNCTECLHACQYAAPHEFAVNVPQTLAQIRLRSYQQYCWPQPLAAAFGLHGIVTTLGLTATLFAALLVASLLASHPGRAAGAGMGFYDVIPHAVMAGAFGLVFALVLVAMCVSLARYAKDIGALPGVRDPRSMAAGLRDAFSLRYLHSAAADCTLSEEVRSPWRRWFHHFTVLGFLLCFAATVVASGYHLLGRQAPYPLLSLPVLLGVVGGIGLLIGPLGLWTIRGQRDPAGRDSAQSGLDQAFIALLVLTSASGLALLAWRDTAAMRLLLLAHLAIVMTLFLTLPYGKFVHGLYRTVALIHHSRESRSA